MERFFGAVSKKMKKKKPIVDFTTIGSSRLKVLF
jgi:hypothetical protein